MSVDVDKVTQTKSLVELVNSEHFKEQLVKAIDDSRDIDYIWDGHDEQPVATFDEDKCIENIIELFTLTLINAKSKRNKIPEINELTDWLIRECRGAWEAEGIYFSGRGTKEELEELDALIDKYENQDANTDEQKD